MSFNRRFSMEKCNGHTRYLYLACLFDVSPPENFYFHVTFLFPLTNIITGIHPCDMNTQKEDDYRRPHHPLHSLSVLENDGA